MKSVGASARASLQPKTAIPAVQFSLDQVRSNSTAEDEDAVNVCSVVSSQYSTSADVRQISKSQNS